MFDMMPYYRDFFIYANSQLPGWKSIESVVKEHFSEVTSHGDFLKWKQAIDDMPKVSVEAVDLSAAAVTVETQLNRTQSHLLKEKLMTLHPWRKGPFIIGDVSIDAEWRGDMKWQRIAGSIDLKNKTVLDVGAGNGYYSWKMLGAGARFVLGIDPTVLFIMQFHAINHFIRSEKVSVVPLRMADIAGSSQQFDVVFSMGVLYHRRDPIVHLEHLRNMTVTGGVVILETLIVDDVDVPLLPIEGRYAKMHNVFELPNLNTLERWFKQAGFSRVQLIDVSKTTVDEQRATEWMRFHSLSDFLDQGDDSKTIEGYPAPVRALYSLQV